MSLRMTFAAMMLAIPLAAFATTAAPPSTAPAAASSMARPALTTSVAGAAAIPTGTTSTPTLDARDLRTFFAGLIPYMLKRNDIAGGVVAVVKGGKLIFEQGYGYANVAKRQPVAADKTLFRIGSVSKLFTWTAVMQLVAAGKINLDADINQYLDFKIPPKYGQPITMRDLMTMTPGFAETIDDLMAPTPKQLVSLRQYLVQHIPPRIFPPGKVVAYSNYGATLAGYIVQRVSGEPFDTYVEQHILKPLHMAHSTFAQPLPKRLKGELATGYITASNKTTVPFEPVQAWPAGSFTSSATDMAKFMIMQLQGGQFDGTSVLPSAIVQLMHSPHYHAAKGINGYDFGFYQENRNGLRIIGHAGDTEAFHSDLHLLLDKDVGIFMSFNSAGKPPNGVTEKVRTQLFRAFLDRYFPYTPPQPPTVATAERDAARVTGWYWPSRRENSALKLLYLLGQVHVSALPNGEITTSMGFLTDPSGAAKHWREIGPLTYQAVHGQARLKFVTNSDGSIRWWTTDDFPPVEVFQPVHGWLAHGIFKPLVSIAIVVFVLTLLIWIGGAITRHHFHQRLAFAPRQFFLRLASRIGVIVQLAVVVGWVGLLIYLSQPLSIFHTDIGGWLLALYILGALGILGAMATILEVAWRIMRGPGGVLVRLGEILLGLCVIYGIWATVACGLVSFDLHF